MKDAFLNCTSLRDVYFPQGLEKISWGAFKQCSSLSAMVIPPSLVEIKECSFANCTGLERVQFCEEIEVFVSASSMSGWWNRREFMTLTPCIYSLLVQYNIPEEICTLPARTWQLNIHEMLRRIPDVVNRTFRSSYLDCTDPSLTREVILEVYLDSISDKIEYYNMLGEVPMLLERAIFGGHGHAETDIVPHILSYL